ncbi:DUF6221 family protein [Streptomyces sp. TOR3209]|uniref:DUF6221 family protein n=1 Tax=Streptomyces sp. TOR3209 TaxID=1073567 RepID=UPI000365E159|nr:DUF6221 family protein [Streptomyces sp. TOR3209]
MDELVQWLRAQLDEDERTARAATAGPWEQTGIGEYGWGVSFSVPGAGVEADDSDQGRADAEHIATWDPARVLREIDAKRQVIAKYTAAVERMAELAALCERLKADGMDTHMPELERMTAIHRRDVLSEVLRLLTLPYAGRPGYREEWRP